MEKTGDNLKLLVKAMFEVMVPEYMPVGIIAAMLGFIYSSNTLVLFNVKLIYLILSVVLIIGGYNSFNAIVDVKIDAINKPHRPLPMKKITIKRVKLITLISFVLAISFSYLINVYSLIITLFTIAFAIIYSIKPINLKGRFIIGTLTANLIYTICFPLMGWSILPSDKIPFTILIYLFIFGFTIAVLKDFEDVLGDSKYGAHTIVNKLGYRKTLLILIISSILNIFILTIFLFYKLINLYYIIILFFFVVVLVLNVSRLFKNKNIKIGRNVFNSAMFIMIIMELSTIVVKFLLK